MKFVKVALPIAINKIFDYSVDTKDPVKEGMRVLVNFHGRRAIGIVVSVQTASTIPNVKPILKVLDKDQVLSSVHIQYAKQLQQQYMYGEGELLFMMVPGYLKKTQKICVTNTYSHGSDNKDACRRTVQSTEYVKGPDFNARYHAWRSWAQQAFKQGSVLICFPQISFLKQAVKVLAEDFPGAVTVLHSGLSPQQMYQAWQRSRNRSILVGTRTALFYFPKDVSLIVVEEETSPHYFQEEKPYYHLADCAQVLSRLRRIPLIVSDEYPRLNTYQAIKQKKATLVEAGKSSPQAKLRVVDMQIYKRRKVISPLLLDLVEKSVKEHGQTIIMWNKKGAGSYVACASCGYAMQCDRCSGFLQQRLQQGICPYCGHQKEIPEMCPQCKVGYIKSLGLGLERIKGMLTRNFPEFTIEPWETHTDKTNIVLATSKILSIAYGPKRFGQGFLLDVDSWLGRASYHASLDAFLYVNKVKRLFTDDLYVFTWNCQHPLFNFLQQDWRAFYDYELQLREEMLLPPSKTLVKVIVRAKKEAAALEKTKALLQGLDQQDIVAYGPFQERPFKLRDYFRYSVVLKLNHDETMRRHVSEQINTIRGRHVKVAVLVQYS